MADVDLDAFRWLLTEEGQRVLARAVELRAAPSYDPVRTTSALRRETTPEQAAVAMTQADLRLRARPKFDVLAEQMYFTPDGLEQATRHRVAQHRAARLAAASPSSLIDLGCGIGGDLIAFATAGIICAGVDLDPVRVAVATANLESLGLGGAVMQADATHVDTSGFEVAFADPARRTARGRTFDVNAYSPPWPFVTGLLDRPACIKVAPGIPHSLVPEGVEAEWVSDQGEVKEAALWSSWLASARRRATVIGQGGLATLTDEDDPGEQPVREVGRFVYEPDGAVIRAGLVTAVCAGVVGWLLDEHIAYVSSDESFRTPFARGYEVLEELPFRERQLKAALRNRGIGRLTIKKRGVEVEPDALRKRLDLHGEDEGTLIMTRAQGTGIALLVRPF